MLVRVAGLGLWRPAPPRSVAATLFALLMLPGITAAQSVDLTTPERTMRSFLTAIEQRDAAALAACFSDSAEGEFDDVRAQRLDASAWRDIQEQFRGAVVTEIAPQLRVAPDGQAMEEDPENVSARVQLRDGEESIHLRKEREGWRIVGF